MGTEVRLGQDHRRCKSTGSLVDAVSFELMPDRLRMAAKPSSMVCLASGVTVCHLSAFKAASGLLCWSVNEKRVLTWSETRNEMPQEEAYENIAVFQELKQLFFPTFISRQN